MDLSDLKSASTYVNNLLLARGLLKNAEPIDFAEPDKAPGGKGESFARIINLVNDLVVKRDVRSWIFVFYFCSSRIPPR